MNILIVGCGKVGARLAGLLSREGHDISVVERDVEKLEDLPEDFTGFKTCGIPIDQDVLRRAGIENCDALAAVSSNDNVNIMVSELAKEIFHVPIVIARTYDPDCEDAFSQFGLHTVCPTNLTVAAVRSAVMENEEPQSININSHTLAFKAKLLPKNLVGASVTDYPLGELEYLYGVVHRDLSLDIYQGQKMRFMEGDRVIISEMVD